MSLRDPNALSAALDAFLNATPQGFICTDAFGTTQCFVVPSPATAALLQQLNQEEALSAFEGGLLRTGDNVASTTVNNLASWLVDRSLRKGSAYAVSTLDEFLKATSTPALQIALIQGLAVQNACELSSCLSLVPITEIPSEQFRISYGRRMTRLQAEEAGRPLSNWEFTLSNVIHPQAALVRRIHTQGTIQSAHVESPFTSFPPFDDPDRDQVHEALDFLALLGPCGPTLVGHWMEPDDSVPLKGYLGGSWDMFHPREIADEVKTVGAAELASFADLYGHFRSAPARLRESLRVPIQRLGAAIRRTQVVDKAIDLGIALEGLLLSDGKSTDTIALPFRLRGAFLLERNSLVQRQRIERLLNVIYSLRSNAVHEGRVPPRARLPGEEERPVAELLNEGIGVFVRIAEAIVRLGRKPDWTSLILGGPP